MKVSIAIATYEMKGSGAAFIRQSLSFISEQSYKDIEVIVSDHSLNDDIKNICDFFGKKINVTHFFNEEKRGSSSNNLNYAISKCNGEIIKILMQDDFLIDPMAIEKIVNKFKDNNYKWLVNGCYYGRNILNPDGGMIPYYDNKKITKGINTISGPSVLTIKSSAIQFFDENLIWMMDCDYYKRLFDKFGTPCILIDKIVFISQHKDQISSWLDEKIKKEEVDLMIKKYNNGEPGK